MVWRTSSGVAAILFAGMVASGCRTSDDDIHRWADTSQGPRKILAVLTHDKYPLDLRVEAAMTLVRMRPRGGRRIGIESLTNALTELTPATRAKIVTPMVPQLEAAIKRPPPQAQAGQPPPADPSVPDKDAAFAMLTFDGATLVEDANSKARLKTALAHWCAADFNRRVDDSSQTYGVEQVLRYLGADGVRPLPDLIVPDAKKIDKVTALIADLGDDATKERASEKLVTVAKHVDSETWLKQNESAVQAANQASKLTPTPDQFKQQMDAFQEEELLRVFQSMQKIGRKPVAGHLLAYAGNSTRPEKRRASALAALAGHIDKSDKVQVEALLSIAEAPVEKSPDPVRDQAFRRIGELPRELAVARLYKIFHNENWLVRMVAADLVLRMSEAKHADEFFAKLGPVKGMAITEPLKYGALLAQLKGGDPAAMADKFGAANYPVTVRLSGLGYYFEHGTKADLAKVKPYEGDRTRAPECTANAKDCEWKCVVGKDKDQKEQEVKSVGDFVTYCLVPAMEGRAQPAPKKPEGT